eukprot:jgi/Chrzof1/3612/Cz13g02100.t1
MHDSCMLVCRKLSSQEVKYLPATALMLALDVRAVSPSQLIQLVQDIGLLDQAYSESILLKVQQMRVPKGSSSKLAHDIDSNHTHSNSEQVQDNSTYPFLSSSTPTSMPVTVPLVLLPSVLHKEVRPLSGSASAQQQWGSVARHARQDLQGSPAQQADSNLPGTPCSIAVRSTSQSGSGSHRCGATGMPALPQHGAAVTTEQINSQQTMCCQQQQQQHQQDTTTGELLDLLADAFTELGDAHVNMERVPGKGLYFIPTSCGFKRRVIRSAV